MKSLSPLKNILGQFLFDGGGNVTAKPVFKDIMKGNPAVLVWSLAVYKDKNNDSKLVKGTSHTKC